MHKLFPVLFVVGLLALGACSSTSSSGTRTLSADRELAEPVIRDSSSTDSLAQPN